MGGNSQQEYLSVSQLTEIIKQILDNSLPEIWVEGEVSNYKVSSLGHAYFTLKDTESAISAVIFKFKLAYLNFKVKDGMKIRVKGKISVYKKSGSYQIVVSSMEQVGTGSILEEIEKLKQKLAAEGLFDSSRKREIPKFPKVIGVVTSPTGAALRDILQILRRRNNKVSVIVFPCAVQGVEAAGQITKQIQNANAFNMCDVLIIGRGGGSIEDLLPFSDEGVVRAIAASKIPTISAVGHEVDWNLSDFAADLRAPTPSAAAELASPVLDKIFENLEKYQADFFRNISVKLDNYQALVKNFSVENLEMRFRSIEAPYIQRLDNAKQDLNQNIKNLLEKKKQELKLTTNTLEQLSPKAILERGYSLVFDSENHKLIKQTEQTFPGQKIQISVSNGTINANVEKSE